MRRHRNDFEKSEDDSLYDAQYDADLIVASFASEYNLREHEQKNMPYAEWRKLLIGLSSDTALGRVIGIRAEKDPKRIAKMSSYEKQVRREWAVFKSKNKRNQKVGSIKDLQKVLSTMFGGN